MSKTVGDYMEDAKNLFSNNTTIDEFKELVNNIADTEFYHFKWPHGETLLHWASAKGSTNICKYLINLGAYINSENMYGCNPLFYASNSKQFETVKFLIQMGADYDCKSTFSGGTPIDPLPSFNLPSGMNIDPCDERDKIADFLIEYKNSREKILVKSCNLNKLLHKTKTEIDSYEFTWILQDVIHGGQCGNRKFGIPDGNAFINFKTFISNNYDKKIYDLVTNPTDFCYNCLKIRDECDDLKRCKTCKEAHYCSIDCQKNDWKYHKKICC